MDDAGRAPRSGAAAAARPALTVSVVQDATISQKIFVASRQQIEYC